MSIDTDPVLELAHRLTEAIREQVEDSDLPHAFVRQAMICVEVDFGPSTTLFSASADDRPWVQVAFLDACATHLEMQRNQTLND